MQTLSEHYCEVLSVEWSPDGSRLATTSPEGITRIFDTTTWQLMAASELSFQGMYSSTWNTDSTRLLVVVSQDSGMEILDGTTAQHVENICRTFAHAFTPPLNPLPIAWRGDFKMRFSPPLQVLERWPGGEVSESPDLLSGIWDHQC